MSRSILIVDDSMSMRQTLAIALRAGGYEVTEAVDGKDALTKLDGRKFNLIISDVNMPNLDGISFVKQAKLLPAYRFTPVLMLTTEGDEKKKMEGKAAGVKAWIVKPFQPPMLLDAVAKLIAA
ncbi:response regulator [Vogesella amnigena]|uniref:Response regulator n=1 Tax=Vogesella amnigena TaxID=1507449 RepID=A0ABV7TRB4_9NEIS